MPEDIIHAAYRKLDCACSRLDHKAFLLMLAGEHETIYPDERRVTRKHLEHAAFPFDGLRECEIVHTPLRLRFGPPGCTVVAESTAQLTLGGRSYQEDLLVQDLWKLEEGEWKLRRRIIMSQRRKSPGYFSLVEHPLFCQFGDLRTEKTTWRESRRA